MNAEAAHEASIPAIDWAGADAATGGPTPADDAKTRATTGRKRPYNFKSAGAAGLGSRQRPLGLASTTKA